MSLRCVFVFAEWLDKFVLSGEFGEQLYHDGYNYELGSNQHRQHHPVAAVRFANKFENY